MIMLVELLSSKVRAEIFRLLFSGDKNSIHLRDLQRQSRLAIGTIQKEILHLKKMDLVISERDGNRLYYSANFDHQLYRDIASLVAKTSGVAENIKNILAAIKDVESAFIYGSFARGEEKSHSDIDLIIIGTVTLRTLSSKFKKITEETGREINPHVYSMRSWKDRLKKNDHFIKSILNEEKIFLVGDENVLS